jgi:4-methyl-5(b-hydroxyethyl)-thiazole monophosphate biosynthesis
MSKAYIFLANGFEMIEGLTVVDIFRRGGVDIKTVSMSDSEYVTSSHKVELKCDLLLKDTDFSDGNMIILPGGMPGTNALMANPILRDLLHEYKNEDKKIAAICAAPSVLGMNGLLKGKRATCYPGFEDKLLGATIVKDKVVNDGNITTAKGMGPALDFALELLEQLEGKEVADRIAAAIQY